MKTRRAKREIVRTSSEEVLQRVYREHVSLIYRYLSLRISNHEDAEDVTADVFLKALCAIDCDRSPKEIRYWLFQIARTTLAEHWRKHAQLPTYSLEEILEWERDEPLEEALPPNKSGRAALLQQLLSIRDTALRLGLTQENVKVVQYRALKRAAAYKDCIRPGLKR